MSETDLKFLAIIIPASVSIVAVTLTYIYKLLSELSDRRRSQKMFLASIRHELILNHRISRAIEHRARTAGFKFVDTAWKSGDTSIVHRKEIPYEDILQIYSNIHLFNLLNDRRSLLTEQTDYPDKARRFAIEHTEMIDLNEEIGKNIENVLSKLNTTALQFNIATSGEQQVDLAK